MYGCTSYCFKYIVLEKPLRKHWNFTDHKMLLAATMSTFQELLVLVWADLGHDNELLVNLNLEHSVKEVIFLITNFCSGFRGSHMYGFIYKVHCNPTGPNARFSLIQVILHYHLWTRFFCPLKSWAGNRFVPVGFNVLRSNKSIIKEIKDYENPSIIRNLQGEK